MQNRKKLDSSSRAVISPFNNKVSVVKAMEKAEACPSRSP